jgi:hypothetical protein
MSFGVLCGMTFSGRLVEQAGTRLTALVTVAPRCYMPLFPGCLQLP